MNTMSCATQSYDTTIRRVQHQAAQRWTMLEKAFARTESRTLQTFQFQESQPFSSLFVPASQLGCIPPRHALRRREAAYVRVETRGTLHWGLDDAKAPPNLSVLRMGDVNAIRATAIEPLRGQWSVVSAAQPASARCKCWDARCKPAFTSLGAVLVSHRDRVGWCGSLWQPGRSQPIFPSALIGFAVQKPVFCGTSLGGGKGGRDAAPKYVMNTLDPSSDA
jgi:hypothetical protein